jgi:hypothetical protein
MGAGVLENVYDPTRTVFWHRSLVKKKTLRVRVYYKTSCHSRLGSGGLAKSRFRPLYVATI